MLATDCDSLGTKLNKLERGESLGVLWTLLKKSTKSNESTRIENAAWRTWFSGIHHTKYRPLTPELEPQSDFCDISFNEKQVFTLDDLISPVPQVPQKLPATPLLVIVNPTPSLTPHPTPPDTPQAKPCASLSPVPLLDLDTSLVSTRSNVPPLPSPPPPLSPLSPVLEAEVLPKPRFKRVHSTKSGLVRTMSLGVTRPRATTPKRTNSIPAIVDKHEAPPLRRASSVKGSMRLGDQPADMRLMQLKGREKVPLEVLASPNPLPTITQQPMRNSPTAIDSYFDAQAPTVESIISIDEEPRSPSRIKSKSSIKRPARVGRTSSEPGFRRTSSTTSVRRAVKASRSTKRSTKLAKPDSVGSLDDEQIPASPDNNALKPPLSSRRAVFTVNSHRRNGSSASRSSRTSDVSGSAYQTTEPDDASPEIEPDDGELTDVDPSLSTDPDSWATSASDSGRSLHSNPGLSTAEIKRNEAMLVMKRKAKARSPEKRADVGSSKGKGAEIEDEEARQRRLDAMFEPAKPYDSKELARTHSGLLSQMFKPQGQDLTAVLVSAAPSRAPSSSSISNPHSQPQRRQTSTALVNPLSTIGRPPTFQRRSTAAPPVADIVPVAPTLSGKDSKSNLRRTKPKDVEYDSNESDSDPENAIQASTSVAEAALRRFADKSFLRKVARQVSRSPTSSIPAASSRAPSPPSPLEIIAAIPLDHPARIHPIPELPLSPNTTRENMLQTLFSTSVRDGAKRQRQVHDEMLGVGRGAYRATEQRSALTPLPPSVVTLTPRVQKAQTTDDLDAFMKTTTIVHRQNSSANVKMNPTTSTNTATKPSIYTRREGKRPAPGR